MTVHNGLFQIIFKVLVSEAFDMIQKLVNANKMEALMENYSTNRKEYKCNVLVCSMDSWFWIYAAKVFHFIICNQCITW